MSIPTAKEDSAAAANILTPEFDERITHTVDLVDETLRDGEQTVGVVFSLEQKVEIAQLLFDAGMTHVMAGFPAVSEAERDAARAIVSIAQGKQLYALARAVPSDVEAVKACGITAMVCWLPISDLHLKYKLGQTEEVALARLLDAVRLGRDAGLKIVVAFEDGTRAPMDRVRRCIDAAVEAGAEIVSVCDTMGILTPFSAYRISRELVQRIGSAAKLSLHFHNDLGMATANTLMATLAGARLITGSFAGLGERAGNVCLEEIAVILRLKYGVDTGIDTTKLSHAARRIAEIAKFQVGAAKPIIGTNAFAHESGIHVQGLTNEPATYEPYPPSWVGGAHVVQFGKHSGIASIRYLARATGISASNDALEETLARIKRRAEESGAPTIAEATSILAAVVAGS